MPHRHALGSNDAGRHRRRLHHFEQVPGQAKARDVGAGGGPVGAKAIGGGLVGGEHGGDRPLDPPALGPTLHIGGKQRPRAQGLGENQRIPRLHTALAEELGWVDHAVAGKAQGELGANGTVTAHQGSLAGQQAPIGARQNLVEQFALFGGGGVGQLHRSQHGVGLGTHGVEVAETVLEADLGKDKGIIHQGGEGIDGVHHGQARRHGDHRRIVGVIKTNQDGCAGYGRELLTDAGQGGGQGGAAYLGSTARAGGRIFRPRTVGRSHSGGHLPHGQVAEAGHEPAIDAVFPAVGEGALDGQGATGGDRIPIPGFDQGEKLALGTKGF
jgi:hypothetical protein